MTTLARRMTDRLAGKGDEPLFAVWDEPLLRDRLWKALGKDRVGLLSLQPACRVEHPHCAFYRSAKQEGLARTTLHTPDGSLNQEAPADAGTGPAPVHRYYVSKTDRYAPLLAFFKDLEVAEDPHSLPRALQRLGDQGLVWALAPSAPADEMALRWRGPADLAADIADPPDRLKPCLRQMRRNFEAQLQCLTPWAGRAAGAWLAWGSVTGALAADDFLRHSQPLYRQLHDVLGRTPLIVPVRGADALAAWRSQPAAARIRGAVPFFVAQEEGELADAAAEEARAVELPPSLCREPERLVQALQTLAGDIKPLWVLPPQLTAEETLAALAALLGQPVQA